MDDVDRFLNTLGSARIAPHQREMMRALLQKRQGMAQIDILIAALRWYADKENYQNESDGIGQDGEDVWCASNIENDEGRLAREALQRCGVDVE